ncbi:MAG: hypothetical protein PHR06_11220, partial [Candidatus Cloacimonetes bacterium]|nr:hypothetical protein [Candidatus Cloacimonadota bacterium]
YEKTNIIDFLKNHYEGINNFFKHNEDNLRTISFCIDQFKKIYHVRDHYKAIKNNQVDIFFSLSILGLEFKSNNLTEENCAKIKLLSSENPIMAAKQEKDPYLSEFARKYLHTDYYRFFYLESLKNYVVNGIFDGQEFSSEIGEIISKVDSKKDFLLKEVSRFYEFEQREIQKKLDKLLEYVEMGEFNFEKYPYIYSLLKYILEKNYLETYTFFNYDMFLRGLERSITRYTTDANVAFSIKSINLDVYDEKFRDEFFQNLERRINQAREEKHINFVTETIDQILKVSNEAILDIKEGDKVWTVYDNIISLLIKHEMLDKLSILNNRGLHWLETYIEHKFEKIPLNNKKLFLAELDILKQFFEVCLVHYDDVYDKMRKGRINDVIKQINLLKEK